MSHHTPPETGISLAEIFKDSPVSIQDVENYFKKSGKLMMTKTLADNPTLTKMIMDNPHGIISAVAGWKAQEGGK